MKSNLFKIISLILLVLGSCLATFLTLDGLGYLTIGETESLEISLSDKTKEYDALPLTITENDYEITKGTIDFEKYELEIIPSRSITEVGEVTCNAEFKVYSKTTGKDVTKLFKFTVNPCKLKVTKRTIAVTCLDTSFEYTGSTLTPERFSLTSGSLVEGHKVSPVVSNVENGVKAGTASCNVRILVIDRNGYEVTSNYSVSYNTEQVYTIEKRKVNFLPTTLSKTYDGNPFVISSFETTYGSLAPGDTVSLQTSESITNAKSTPYSLTIKATFKNKYGENISDCYDFVSSKYNFTIEPIKVEVQLPILSKTYDSKNFIEELSSAINTINNSLTIDGSISLKDSCEDIIANIKNVNIDDITGNVTNYPLELSYFEKTCDDSNYELVLKSGSLTINPRELQVTFPNLEKTYDGNTFTVSDIEPGISAKGIIDKDNNGATYTWNTLFELEKEGDVVKVPSIKNALLYAKSYYIELKVVDDYKDIANNYKIIYNDGSIMIHQRVLNFNFKNDIKPRTTDLATAQTYLSNSYTLTGNYTGQIVVVSNYGIDMSNPLALLASDSINVTAVEVKVGTELSNLTTIGKVIDVPEFSSSETEWNEYIDYLKLNSDSTMEDPRDDDNFDFENNLHKALLAQYALDLKKHQSAVQNVIFTTNTGSITFKDVVTVTIKTSSLTKEFDGSPFSVYDLDGHIELDATSSIADADLSKVNFIMPEQFTVCNKIKGAITATYNTPGIDVVVNIINNEDLLLTITKKEITLKVNTNTLISKVYDGTSITVPTSHITDPSNYLKNNNLSIGSVKASTSLSTCFTENYRTIDVSGVTIVNKNGLDVTSSFEITLEGSQVKYKINKRVLYVSLIDYTFDRSLYDEDEQQKINLFVAQLVNCSLANGDSITDSRVVIVDALENELEVKDLTDLSNTGTYQYSSCSLTIKDSYGEACSSCYSLTIVNKGTFTII